MKDFPPNKVWHKDFVLIWQGQFVSLIGSQAFFIGMMFWIKHTTGSAALMGTLMMAANIPAVLLSPIGGTVADHYNRKNIIIITDIISGIAVIMLAALVYFYPDATELILAYLFFVAVLMGATGAFFRPAVLAALPDLIVKEKLPAANAIIQATIQIAMLIGNAVGGVLFRLLGAPLLFFLNGLTYLFSAISEAFVYLPDNAVQKEHKQDSTMTMCKGMKCRFASFASETKEGFHYLMKKPGMREFFLFAAAINFFSVPAVILLPFYVEDYLHLATDWYGFLISSYGLGALVGYAVAGVIKLHGNARLVALAISFTMIAFGVGGLGIIQNQYAAMLTIFVMGVCNAFLNVNLLTIIQFHTEDHIRGRVFGLLGLLTGGITPIAMGLSGIIFDLLDRSFTSLYMGTAMLILLTGVGLAMSKNYRDLLRS